MTERDSPVSEEDGSAVNKVLNRIAEAAGFGTSETDREETPKRIASGDSDSEPH